MIEGRTINVIVAREFKKFIREKSRLFSAIARPLFWLFFVGGGLSGLVPMQGKMSYIQFLFPGIIGMTILFSAIFSAISIIWDKEFGYMKEMLVAPVSRTSIVVGKALSGSAISTLQAAIILMLFPVIGLRLGVHQIVLVLLVSFGLSFAISSMGILIATFYESFESFSVIMNFIVMPMFFLSGAMYPVRTLPEVLRIISKFNPLTYGVDALKNIIFPLEKGSMGPEFSIYLDVGIILFVSVIFTTLGTIAFRRRV